jgi:hypothetical protein
VSCGKHNVLIAHITWIIVLIWEDRLFLSFNLMFRIPILIRSVYIYELSVSPCIVRYFCASSEWLQNNSAGPTSHVCEADFGAKEHTTWMHDASRLLRKPLHAADTARSGECQIGKGSVVTFHSLLNLPFSVMRCYTPVADIRGGIYIIDQGSPVP